MSDIWHHLSIFNVLKKQASSLHNGMQSDDVATRQQTYGFNALTQKKNKSLVETYDRRVDDFIPKTRMYTVC